MNRGMTVLTTWRLLLGDRKATEEEYFSAIVLAYCVELVCSVIFKLKYS